MCTHKNVLWVFIGELALCVYVYTNLCTRVNVLKMCNIKIVRHCFEVKSVDMERYVTYSQYRYLCVHTCLGTIVYTCACDTYKSCTR